MSIAVAIDKSKTNKEQTEAALAKLHNSVATMTTGEEWEAYLSTLARFHGYSARNLMWMFCQWQERQVVTNWMRLNNGTIPALPDFSRPAGFKAWEPFGRSVKPGEKGLSVLAPVLVNDKDAAPGPDGKPRKKLIGFKLVSRTFDVSQTEGDDLPADPIVCERLQGAAPAGIIEALTTIADRIGFTVEFVPTIWAGADANGMCEYGAKKISVRDDLSPAQTAKTLTHEIAHALLHGPGIMKGRPEIETEAESVAYVVMSALGVEADGYSIGYVASWSKGDGALIARTAERVVQAAQIIFSALDDQEAAVKPVGPHKSQLEASETQAA